MSRKTTLRILAATLIGPLLVLGLAIGFVGPQAPAPLASIGDPFKAVDFSDAPALSRYRASDGAALAYRRYSSGTPARGSIVLIHGSTGSSLGMHPLAKAFAQA